jgi:hypothetical protein
MTVTQMLRTNWRAFRRVFIKHGPTASPVARAMPWMLASGSITPLIVNGKRILTTRAP